MANDLVDVVPQILAQGMMALRSTCVMPQIVNYDYGEDAKAKGETVDVPIPSAVPAQDVVPGPYSDNTPDVGPTTVPIKLDQWKEAPFQLSDKDIADAMDGIIPMQASEAIKSIAMAVNADIFSKYVYIGGGYGTPGTTPFDDGTTKDASQTRKVLNQQFANLGDRRFVLDPDAEANALDIRAFQDYGWSNALDVIRAGQISEQRLGFDWFMDQQVPVHTSGDAAGKTVSGPHTAGVKTTTIATSAGTGSFNIGDIITFAGSAWQYAVIADGGSSITISPGLKMDLAGGEAITLEFAAATNSPQNLAFHRDCFGFATRPLVDEIEGLGNIIQSGVDPVSGLTLRLEVTREHKRTRWSYDLLWGSAVPRPELGVRCFG